MLLFFYFFSCTQIAKVIIAISGYGAQLDPGDNDQRDMFRCVLEDKGFWLDVDEVCVTFILCLTANTERATRSIFSSPSPFSFFPFYFLLVVGP
tara:strand:+ start:49 stop:330 length:282 start_codon:yes stop_codon:yes gene_type:complete